MTSTPAAIRSILFDLGSTLWEHAELATIQREESAADARAGATLRELQAAQMDAQDEPDKQEDRTRGHELRQRWFRAVMSAYAAEPLLEPGFPSLARDVMRSMGHTQADERWGALVYEAMRVRSLHARVLFPDVLETLEILRERGYTLGVVTNRAYGGPVFLDDLRQMGLLRFFGPHTIAISADLGYRKPHPTIFHYALVGLGRAPHETAMVGDKLHADVQGARQLGMYSIWRPDAHEADMPVGITPNAVIRQTDDLLTLFPQRS
jgi:putative hydrolase of the HAD superfamily